MMVAPQIRESPWGNFKRTQRKYVKKSYRVRNWRKYEAGLRKRGSLTVWIKDIDTVTGKIFG